MHHKSIKYTLLLLWLISATTLSFGQKKKKVSPGQNQNNILKRAYSDVLTRNNWYFNAQIIYKDMLTDYNQARKVDYDDLLPFYFHDWDADFTAYNAELETVIKKTSIVSQIRNESRWEDNVYLLLGKARYLQKDYTNAFETFKYIVTTMEGDLSKSVNKYNQKDRSKYLRKKKKELEKQSKEKSKALELKNKIKEKLSEIKTKTKEKEIAQTSKEKQKALEKKIKLKKKAIKKKNKGKTVKKDYNKINGVKETEKEEDKKANSEKKEEVKKETEKKKETIENYENVQIKNSEYKENEDQGIASDTLTEKEKALLEKLTLWEKLKHKKSRPEAIVWMAKAAIQIGNMALAKNMILYGEEMGKLSKKQLKELYLAETYYYIHRNSFELAIEPLMIALEWCKKDEKVWYLFILSQFYEKLNMPEDASLILEKAISSKGDFKTRLYAKINKARLDAENNLTDKEEIIKSLEKLGKKGNNKDFRGDIYFALAEIYEQQNEIKKAESSYLLAINNSTNNPKKKTLSYLELSNLYYQENNYIGAFKYLDSAVVIGDPILKNKEEYLKTRLEGLKIVTEKLELIKENDSLLTLSMLSETDLQNLVKEEIKEEKKEKRKQRFLPQADNQGASNFPLILNAPTVNISSNTDWYFYNEELKTRGFNEFKSIWGSRKLQDNWRRSTLSFEDIVEEEPEETKIETKTLPVDDNKREDFFARIPKSKKGKDSIKLVNINEYYTIGMSFMQNIEDPKKAIEYLEKSLSLGLDYEKKPETYYALYLLYKELSTISKSNYYKELLIRNYPSNILTKNLNQEPSVKKDTTYVDKIEKLYTSTYNDFLNENYVKVISDYDIIHRNNGENVFTPKFKFLQALSYGHLDSLATLKKILTEIVNKYPNHEVKQKAVEYLAILNQEKITTIDNTSNNKENSNSNSKKENKSIYKLDDDNSSLFGMVLINNSQVNIQETMDNLKKFNDEYFKEDLYKISNAFLSVKEPILLVKRFKNKNEGIKYYNKLLDLKIETFGKFNVDSIEVYLISQNNFKELFGSKDIKLYREFFIDSYLNNK